MFEFRFPTKQQQYHFIQTADELRLKLKEEAKNQNISFQYYKISCNKEQYLYAHCSKCNCKLKWRKSPLDTGFNLLYFKNVHKHKEQQLRIKIQDFIKSFPLTSDLPTIKSITKTHFKISDSKFYYHLKRIQRSKQFFGQFLDFLNKNNYQTRCHPFPLNSSSEIPQIFITSSLKMRQNFQKFGDFCTIDFTYNLVKEYRIVQRQQGKKSISKQGKKSMVKWAIGFILGKNQRNKIIPFALIATNNETKEYMKMLFLTFFDIMKAKKPQSIISDQQNTIISALQQLKKDQHWQGQVLIDTYHYLRSIKKKTEQNQPLFNHLHQALFATDKKEYQYHIEKSKMLIRNPQQSKLIDDFIQKAPMTCISKTKRFHGISISTSPHQKAHEKLKNYIRYQHNIIQTLRKSLKMLQYVQLKSSQFRLNKVKYQQTFNNPDIKLIRHSISEQIFNFFIKEYAKSLSIPYTQHGDSFTFGQEICTIDHNNKKIICSCQMQQRTDVPCIHLIKSILISRQNLLRYFNKRWLIVSQKALQDEPNNKMIYEPQTFVKKGRPRKSRRNRSLF